MTNDEQIVYKAIANMIARTDEYCQIMPNDIEWQILASADSDLVAITWQLFADVGDVHLSRLSPCGSEYSMRWFKSPIEAIAA